MIVVFQTKRGPHGINVNKILHAYPYFSGVRIELEDGTYVDVQASIEEVCTICNLSSIKKESVSNYEL